MHDASVGFQCPSCVAEGSKTTRAARTPYGGLRSSNPGIVSKALIGINAAVWLLIVVSGGAASRVVNQLALTPRGQCRISDGRYFPAVTNARVCGLRGDTTWVHGVATGAPWQLLTSMFTHVEVWHIGFNMLALWVLGPQLEQILGRLRYLGLYLLSGLVGSAVVYWLSDPTSQSLGASGAVFGLMGALLLLAFKVKADVNQLLLWIGLNFAITFFGRGFISWQAHVGGFVGGVALAAILAYAPRARRTTWQAVGFGAVSVLVMLAIALRTATIT